MKVIFISIAIFVKLFIKNRINKTIYSTERLRQRNEESVGSIGSEKGQPNVNEDMKRDAANKRKKILNSK